MIFQKENSILYSFRGYHSLFGSRRFICSDESLVIYSILFVYIKYIPQSDRKSNGDKNNVN